MPSHPSLIELRTKVDSFFARVKATHATAFACRQGCTDCCAVDLSVFPVEAMPIREALGVAPDALRQAIAAKRKGGEHCVMLVDGACAIYEQRPIICRSQGLPLHADEDRATCPRNFIGQDLAALATADVLNLNTLNTLLSILHQVYCRETGSASDRLSLSDLLWQPESGNAIWLDQNDL